MFSTLQLGKITVTYIFLAYDSFHTNNLGSIFSHFNLKIVYKIGNFLIKIPMLKNSIIHEISCNTSYKKERKNN